MKTLEESVGSFKKWLASQGFVPTKTTSEYEVFRFNIPNEKRRRFNSGGLLPVLVLYRKQNGSLTVTDPIQYWFAQYSNHENAEATEKGRRPGKRKRLSLMERLLQRDGHGCWYCGQLGEDTLEHILSIKAGGKNNMGNCVRAHRDCNNLAGSRSIAEKVALREEIRDKISSIDFPPWDFFDAKTMGVISHDEYQRKHTTTARN